MNKTSATTAAAPAAAFSTACKVNWLSKGPPYLPPSAPPSDHDFLADVGNFLGDEVVEHGKGCLGLIHWHHVTCLVDLEESKSVCLAELAKLSFAVCEQVWLLLCGIEV